MHDSFNPALYPRTPLHGLTSQVCRLELAGVPLCRCQLGRKPGTSRAVSGLSFGMIPALLPGSPKLAVRSTWLLRCCRPPTFQSQEYGLVALRPCDQDRLQDNKL